jgi:hypothetical protein
MVFSDPNGFEDEVGTQYPPEGSASASFLGANLLHARGSVAKLPEEPIAVPLSGLREADLLISCNRH